MKIYHPLIFLFISLLYTTGTMAEEVSTKENARYHIKRTGIAIKIDGVECKKEWNKAPFIDKLYNHNPTDIGISLNPSEKRLAFENQNLYIFVNKDSKKAISFDNDLKSWEFVSKRNEKSKALAGKLINENKGKAITMPPKGDWSVFEIKSDIHKGIITYSLLERPLKKGEKVRFLGYPFNTTVSVNREASFLGLIKEDNFSLDVSKGNYSGCSGGPVLDTNDKVLGLVAMGYFNEKENNMVFAPAPLEYFKTVIKHYSKGYGKTKFYTKLTGIISPNLEYLGRGKVSQEKAATLKHYRFTYNEEGNLLNIRYFDKNEPDNNSYYGTHEVRYAYLEDQLIRSYYDAEGKKATTYRHYYFGNDIHKEVFQLDKNQNKTSLILKDSSDNQTESGMGSYLFKFQKIDNKTFIQWQFKKDGTPNVLTRYFPFHTTKISVDQKGFLQSIVNVDNNGDPILNINAGYAAVTFDFDEYGNELGWSFHDVQNNLANRNNYLDMDYDFAKVVYDFNWKNKNLGLYNGFKESYFDANNQPTENNKGIHSIHYEYDKNGMFIKMVNYNLDGKEVES